MSDDFRKSGSGAEFSAFVFYLFNPFMTEADII